MSLEKFYENCRGSQSSSVVLLYENLDAISKTERLLYTLKVRAEIKRVSVAYVAGKSREIGQTDRIINERRKGYALMLKTHKKQKSML